MAVCRETLAPLHWAITGIWSREPCVSGRVLAEWQCVGRPLHHYTGPLQVESTYLPSLVTVRVEQEVVGY